MPDLFVSNPNTKSTEKPAQQNSAAPSAVVRKKRGLMNPLSSLCEYPKGISFQSQAKDEAILLLARKHFVTNLGWIIAVIVLLLIPPLFGIIINLFDETFVTLPPQFVFLSILFYFCLVFTYAFSNFITWFYNILLITQKEIVDIDYSHLIYHDVAATNVNLVEDVNYIQGGFFRGIFNFGDVFVQTAGGKENIEAFAIPRPAMVAKIILNLIGHSGGLNHG